MTPDEIKHELPVTDRAAAEVYRAREQIRDVVHGRDPRILVVAGPCSIHDPAAALDYAERLFTLYERHKKHLLVCMRVYFEKPRTTVGWKGLINDPHLDGSSDVETGLKKARKLLLDLAHLGLPTATEMLDPIVPQYIADLVCWAAIGARTTESQTHREMASGLSMPVGFKNGTDGSPASAIHAMIAASRPHSFLGIDGRGRVSVVRTAGNPDAHLVLRGGLTGPNYDAASVLDTSHKLAQAGVNARMLVDCSHDNSGKDHHRQYDVVREVARQLREDESSVLGVMVESHLVAGRQSMAPKSELRYGQSITDACVDFETTQAMLAELVSTIRGRRAAA
jgi:3-deoxy-7-phosphoheptulonate synthase